MIQISSPAVGNLTSALPTSQAGQGNEPSKSFASVFEDTLDQMRQTDQASGTASLNLLTGNTDNLSSTMISTEKAEIAIKLTAAVRNKVMDAYKEIMNMQV